MGTDQLGNKYFENKEEYQYGHHRWVEYANHRSFYDADPTLVPPEWHVWLHCITDDPPTAVRRVPFACLLDCFCSVLGCC